METSDDYMHTIEHIGEVPFNNGNNSYMKDVLHVPTITKNLVSVGQISEQGMIAQFTLDSCFIKDKGRSNVHPRCNKSEHRVVRQGAQARVLH